MVHLLAIVAFFLLGAFCFSLLQQSLSTVFGRFSSAGDMHKEPNGGHFFTEPSLPTQA